MFVAVDIVDFRAQSPIDKERVAVDASESPDRRIHAARQKIAGAGKSLN
jgi:hypothetical protein